MNKQRQNKPVKKRYERPGDYPKRNKRRRQRNVKTTTPMGDYLCGFLLLAYILVVTFTPNWQSLDTNASKFLTLSIVNLVSFLFLLSRPDFRKEPGSLWRFFNPRLGLIYGGFLVASLLAFTQAVNLLESVLHFAKLLAAFTAAFVVGTILIQRFHLVKFVVVVMTALLIFDALSVFYDINRFIQGEIARISDIKTVYSNKNILASSIFVKLPFALYLLMFAKGWQKTTGWVALTMGFAATFFMATRAFYLGLLVLSLVFVGYVVMHYFRQKRKEDLVLVGSYVGSLLLALALFSVVQQNFYPSARSQGRHTQGVGQQLATIQEFDSSTGLRIDSWRWTLQVIKDNPVFGVGPGNWKVDILEHENQKNTGFIYLYKAHNDFLEVTAETGLVGGLLFLGIFIMAGLGFVLHYRKTGGKPDAVFPALFLAASGLAFYAVDAFFNFPADRPEILLLFALYVGIGVAAAYLAKHQTAAPEADAENNEAGNPRVSLAAPLPVPEIHPGLHKFLLVLAIVVLAGSIKVFQWNFQSARLQRLVYQEIMAGNLRLSSDRIVGQFPVLPAISMWGESITSLQARYLLQEEKYEETLHLLRGDQNNPYDGRREFFMAQAFQGMEQPDSAQHYASITYKVKPYYYRNVHLIKNLLEQMGRSDEVYDYIDAYLERHKDTPQVYLYSTGFYRRQGELDRAMELIELGREELPRDTLIRDQYRFLYREKYIVPNREIIERAVTHYNAGNHAAALEIFNEYLLIAPEDPNAYRLRAFSNYNLGNYQQGIDDINYYFEIHEVDGSLLNLRGVCKRNLEDAEGACEDFLAAMRMGVESAATNYERFCRE